MNCFINPFIYAGKYREFQHCHIASSSSSSSASSVVMGSLVPVDVLDAGFIICQLLLSCPEQFSFCRFAPQSAPLRNIVHGYSLCVVLPQHQQPSSNSRQSYIFTYREFQHGVRHLMSRLNIGRHQLNQNSATISLQSHTNLQPLHVNSLIIFVPQGTHLSQSSKNC